MFAALTLPQIALASPVLLSAGWERSLSDSVCCAYRVGAHFAPLQAEVFFFGGYLTYAPGPPSPSTADIATVRLMHEDDDNSEAYVPVQRRVLTADLTAGVHPSQLSQGALAGGPLAFAGLGVARSELYGLVYAHDSDTSTAITDYERIVHLSRVWGAGLEGWVGPRIGARITWSTRRYPAMSPNRYAAAPPRLRETTTERTLNLDLVVRL